MKTDHSIIPDAEWQKPRDNAWKAILAADYKKAIWILTPVFKKYPGDFKVIYFYASTLADYSEFQPPKRRKALKAQGCKLLLGLLKRMRGISRPLAYATRNEYYYHSGKFDRQYALGAERVKAGDKHGYYSQGVGSAWHAYGHARKGRRHLAGLWAKRAVRAWESLQSRKQLG
ncbi:MAG: hypothetical protein HY550_01285 [Elusimicrobia bacterium]|nr:hypothetical protein [Elusimicrobiota bacterium]